MPDLFLKPPALDTVETWIFDLDNTLYPASCDLFSQVSHRMGAFIADRFDLTWDDAKALQRDLFLRHGTTLRGLMSEHDLEADEFLDYVHAIDLSPLPTDTAITTLLARLPGRKLIYTNASAGHARNVLTYMAIDHHFEAIYDIVLADFVPKPDPRPYADLIARYDVDPSRACMIEDMAKNLKPAHALGMATVWIESDHVWARPGGDDDHVHHRSIDLVTWLENVVSRTADPSQV